MATYAIKSATGFTRVIKQNMYGKSVSEILVIKKNHAKSHLLSRQKKL